MHRVMVSAPYMQPVIDRFSAVFADAGIEPVLPVVRERMEEEQLLEIVGDLDGAICGDDRFTRRVLLAAPRLKVISKWGTGVDSIDADTCRELGIRLCRTPGAFTIPVADSVFAYMLCFARRVLESTTHLRAGRWEKIPGVTLSELTLGIVGVGDIGREVARRAAAMHMTILGHDLLPPPESFVRSTGIVMTSLEDLLRRSDVVTLHVDLNPSSRHLINPRTLGLIKPGAILINTSRGPVVDEAALVGALRSGRLGGAALDVFEIEPLPLDSPLARMDNVLLAPHNANSSPAAWEWVHHNTINNLLEGLKEVCR